MNKPKQFICFLCVFSAFVFSTFSEAAAHKQGKPNIILIMPDDAGYGDYACLGNPYIKTPVVDSFKEQSLLFPQFHVSPKCGPSRAALMTGCYPLRVAIEKKPGGDSPAPVYR